MKRILTPAMALAVLSITAAHADTLADWTFETTTPTTAGPLSPEGGLQTSTAQASLSGVGTVSSPVGDGSAHSFSANGWTTSSYFQFSLNSVGYQDIVISWDQGGSNTGPRDFGLFYSINGGAYTQSGITSPDTTALYNSTSSPNGAWNSTTHLTPYTSTFDLTSIAGLDDDASISFRIEDLDTTSVAGGTVGTTGTDRIDNFLVTGDLIAVPEPGTATLAALGGLGCLFAFRRRR